MWVHIQKTVDCQRVSYVNYFNFLFHHLIYSSITHHRFPLPSRWDIVAKLNLIHSGLPYPYLHITNNHRSSGISRHADHLSLRLMKAVALAALEIRV